jgi:curved DNA-binding protein CbpA
MEVLDYYEFLQISPNAEPATIHRVYRFLAGRLHPDIPGTGDAEKFRLLKEAFDVLSDPERRAKYDATNKKEAPPAAPLSTTIDFMDNIDGELNRRLAVLALLYIKRRTNPYNPEVSLAEVERRMGFPREYLQFTTWYLWNKKFITQADNSDFTLTAAGVDFVEEKRGNIPILNRLLTDGTVSSGPDDPERGKALRDRNPIIMGESTNTPPEPTTKWKKER